MSASETQTDEIRSFNRFYTRQIGLLGEGLLKTSFSLTQARILYELGRHSGIPSTALVEQLDLDPGYLSRLLKAFQAKGLIKRSNSKDDRRVGRLSLTAKGRTEFERLDSRSRAEVGELLANLNAAERERLVNSMATIQQLLESPKETQQFALRTHRPGDIGWLIKRHGELYAEEYQWDSSFESLVAEIGGAFLRHFDEQSERCWIAERNGERFGGVLLLRQSKTVAKLRLLLVEPSGRGLGIGTRLVDECVAFARQKRYRKITLWTNDILHAARKIYERAGFCLIKEEKHHSFGHHLTGQFWELPL